MIQRLYQQVQGIVSAAGTVVLTMPPVPQALMWTGSVSLSTSAENALAITGGLWTAARNGQPLVTYGGTGVVADVQLVSQEVLTITGSGLKPGIIITAVWMGTSEDASGAELKSPKVYGAINPYSQVYTDVAAGPGSALQTVPVPAPSALQSAQATGSGSGTTTILTAGASPLSLWSVTLGASVANTSTTAAAFNCSFIVQTSTGAQLLAVEPMVVQASSASMADSMNLWGLYLPAGVSLQLVIGAYAGTGGLRGHATVVYGPNA